MENIEDTKDIEENICTSKISNESASESESKLDFLNNDPDHPPIIDNKIFQSRNQFIPIANSKKIRLAKSKMQRTYSTLQLYLIISIPLIICNFCYAFNDKSCTTISAKPLNINLKEYLICSGCASLCMVILMYHIIINYNDNFYDDFEPIEPDKFLTEFTVIYWGLLFTIIWDVLGGLIFWRYINIFACSYSIFNYMNASLIIKYFLHLMIIMNSNEDSNIMDD